MNFVINFLSAILILFAVITSGFEPPKFSSEYYVEGTFYRPYRDWEIKFHAYYDLPNKRSRIDYNDGTENWVKTYQLPEKHGGELYKFTLGSDAIRDDYNMPICFKMSQINLIQDVLPYTNGFNFEKQLTFKGKSTDVYINNYTQYKNSFEFVDRYWVNWKQEEPIPLRFERIVYNLGTTNTNRPVYADERWFVDYSFYQPGPINPEVFEFEGGHNCIMVDKDPSILNPLGNFINEVQISYGNDSIDDILVEFELGVRLDLLDEKRAELYEFDDHDDLPDQLDLRLSGAIYPVQDQQYCKASYAFVAAGIVEGTHFKRTGVLFSLSKQALVDASFDSLNDEANQGCNGGSIGYSLKWIQEMSGLPRAGDYKPYMALEGFSDLDTKEFVAPIKKYYKIKKGNVNDVKKALVEHGPVGTVINNARATSFLFYAGGIYNDTECNYKPTAATKQSVLIVGYGVDNGKEYWIVKNSWSPYWGIDGYIHISTQGNVCGILDTLYFAVSGAKKT